MSRGSYAAELIHYSVAVGEVLRECREDAGLTLNEVEEITSGRLKASIVSAYERADRSASLERLLELARFYQVPPDLLLSVIEKRCQR